MARWAMVHDETSFVGSIIEWDGDVKTWKPPTGYTMVEDKEVCAGPGFRYVDGEFIPPPGGEVE